MSNAAGEFFAKFPGDLERMKQGLPDAVKGFGTLFQNVMKEGTLGTKQKELVALGIAVAQRCVPCIYLHVQKSLGAGATREEILEATGVAVMMQGGPAYTHIPVVLDALEALAK
jgi:AhpD family alkylhydroperoxidase